MAKLLGRLLRKIIKRAFPEKIIELMSDVSRRTRVRVPRD